MTMIYSTAKIAKRTKIIGASDSRIGDFTFISCQELHLGEGACINRFCEIQGRGVVRMGKFSQIASHTSIITSSDTPWGSMSDSVPEEFRRINTGDVTIGEHAYIGPYVTIMPGVTIGDRAVVGAYSYIATDVKPGTVIHPRIRLVGNPRKVDPLLYGFFDIREVPEAEEYYEEEEIVYEQMLGEE